MVLQSPVIVPTPILPSSQAFPVQYIEGSEGKKLELVGFVPLRSEWLSVYFWVRVLWLGEFRHACCLAWVACSKVHGYLEIWPYASLYTLKYGKP